MPTSLTNNANSSVPLTGIVDGGFSRYIGAIELAAKAGFRAGSGYVKAVVPEEIENLINNNIPELITEKYDNLEIHNLIYWADAIIIGPGFEFSSGNISPNVEIDDTEITLPTINHPSDHCMVSGMLSKTC